MIEQYQLRFSTPESFLTLCTGDLGATRRVVIGNGEDCDRKVSGAVPFAVELTRVHDRWALAPAGEETWMYLREGADQFSQVDSYELTDRAVLSVCGMQDGEMTEVMQIIADADRSATVNTRFDLRIPQPQGRRPCGGSPGDRRS